ncbi:hypothetical protein BpHYR1_028377 [Brachionus plicatilis]|uniref:Uncharacterized protein n=1 Tax=Brachionus plicatilis TaxID=10195 RepID=A0A3M7QQN8_BRAPC|nr:hypothetical protein BpHYR1_028377 [Brachionus plicatilis]
MAQKGITLENACKQIANYLQYFMVVTNELSQVSVSVGIFGSENRSYSVDFFKIGSNCHLFVQLRRLSQICRILEITYFENIGATFRCRIYNLGCMNFNKSLSVKSFTEKSANTGFYSVNGLVMSCLATDISSASTSGLMASSIKRGSRGSAWLTTNTWVTWSSTSFWVHDSILVGDFLKKPSTSIILSLAFTHSETNFTIGLLTFSPTDTIACMVWNLCLIQKLICAIEY